jgi:hypothetical protein
MNNIIRIPNTFTITTQPFYDQYNQCYKNIVMCNIEPQGPLRNFVRRIKLPRLSEFHREGPCNSIQQCGLAITNFPNHQNISYTGCCKQNSGCNLMTPNDIPNLISFLLSNGYQIDTQISNMLNQSEVKLTNQRNILTATYYGNAQPSIVYMR